MPIADPTASPFSRSARSVPDPPSIRPTGPIWRQVVADEATCFRTGCDAASTEDDLDHRVAWPLGPTDVANLWPGCRTDHRAKHAPGFSIEQADDGSYALRTAAGFRHLIAATSHPVAEDFGWPETADDFQFSATELRQVIETLREFDELDRVPTAEQLWEEGFDDGLTEEQYAAVYARTAA